MASFIKSLYSAAVPQPWESVLFVHININRIPYGPLRRSHISPKYMYNFCLYLLQKHNKSTERQYVSSAKVDASLPSWSLHDSGGDALMTQQQLSFMKPIQSVCFMTFADLIQCLCFSPEGSNESDLLIPFQQERRLKAAEVAA